MQVDLWLCLNNVCNGALHGDDKSLEYFGNQNLMDVLQL